MSANLKTHSWKHLNWLLKAAVLAFGIPFIFSRVLGFSLDLYFVILAILSIGFFIYYWRSSELHWSEVLKPGWALGIILGIFFGLAFISNSTASSDSGHGFSQVMTFSIVSRAVIYGFASALLLTVVPFIVTWRSLAGPTPMAFRKFGVTLMALISIVAMSFLYNIGLDGRNNSVNGQFEKSIIASVPTLISGNPMASSISNVFLQVSQNSVKTNVAQKPIETAKSKTTSGGIN